MSFRRWTAVLLPPSTAVVVYAWAFWFSSASGLPLSVGIAVGGVATVAALAACTALVKGVGCFFGVLLTAPRPVRRRHRGASAAPRARWPSTAR
jgi:hypothetical protein